MPPTRPVMRTNTNITGDNWFYSVELVDKLKENDLTYVRTMHKNLEQCTKREVPKEYQEKEDITDDATPQAAAKEEDVICVIVKTT